MDIAPAAAPDLTEAEFPDERPDEAVADAAPVDD